MQALKLRDLIASSAEIRTNYAMQDADFHRLIAFYQSKSTAGWGRAAL